MCFCETPGAGWVISLLSKGDEIKIKKGFGYPKAEKDVVEIIADVDEYSALTNTGRALSCHDVYGITITGRHFDNFTISSKAQIMLERVSLQKAPEGKFRVIAGTPFDEDWALVGDYDTIEGAIAIIDNLLPAKSVCVYDDRGERLYESGAF